MEIVDVSFGASGIRREKASTLLATYAANAARLDLRARRVLTAHKPDDPHERRSSL